MLELGSVKRWLLNRDDGFFIVRLGARRRHGTSFDHVIDVNCKEKVVSHCVEKYEMKFVYEVFQYCVGYDVCKVYFREVKELCSQPEGENKRKPHKVSPEKKKQRWAEQRAVGN